MPVLTAIIIIFIVWLQYELRKGSKLQKRDTDNFWEKEKQANLIRRKDISNLDYLTITTESLPMEDHEDSTVNSYRDTILKLTEKKILNLSGYTNTQLKNMYGVANMTLLSEYDNNYTILVSILQKWAERLYLDGSITASQAVLEYAISVKTDVTKTYRLLAEIYQQQKQSDKIGNLLNAVSQITIREKEQLVQDLNKLMNS